MPESHFTDEIPLKFGRDDKIEKDANEWLSRGVGENKRSEERTAEKVAFELGLLTEAELQFYDPRNYWDTKDSAYMVSVNPSDMDILDPTICATVNDGNVRAKNSDLLKRQALRRHKGDAEGWGSDKEDIPALGGGFDKDRWKICAKCSRHRPLELFYAQPRNKDGLSSWCKPCQKSINQARKRLP